MQRNKIKDKGMRRSVEGPGQVVRRNSDEGIETTVILGKTCPFFYFEEMPETRQPPGAMLRETQGQASRGAPGDAGSSRDAGRSSRAWRGCLKQNQPSFLRSPHFEKLSTEVCDSCKHHKSATKTVIFSLYYYNISVFLLNPSVILKGGNQLKVKH